MLSFSTSDPLVQYVSQPNLHLTYKIHVQLNWDLLPLFEIKHSCYNWCLSQKCVFKCIFSQFTIKTSDCISWSVKRWWIKACPNSITFAIGVTYSLSRKAWEPKCNWTGLVIKPLVLVSLFASSGTTSCTFLGLFNKLLYTLVDMIAISGLESIRVRTCLPPTFRCIKEAPAHTRCMLTAEHFYVFRNLFIWSFEFRFVFWFRVRYFAGFSFALIYICLGDCGV